MKSSPSIAATRASRARSSRAGGWSASTLARGRQAGNPTSKRLSASRSTSRSICVELGALGAQELAPRRHVEEQVAHFDGRAGRDADAAPGRSARRRPPRPRARSSASRGRDTMRMRDTDAMLGSASPRKPSVRTASRSSMLPILLVAWRASASTQFVRRDADAVVAHAAQFRAALLDLDLDRAARRRRGCSRPVP